MIDPIRLSIKVWCLKDLTKCFESHIYNSNSVFFANHTELWEFLIFINKCKTIHSLLIGNDQFEDKTFLNWKSLLFCPQPLNSRTRMYLPYFELNWSWWIIQTQLIYIQDLQLYFWSIYKIADWRSVSDIYLIHIQYT